MPGIWRSPSGMTGNVVARAPRDLVVHEDLAGRGGVAQPGREVDRHPDEVVALEHDDRPAAMPMRSGRTMSAFSICSVRSSTVSTTGRDLGAHEHAAVAEPLPDPDAVVGREPAARWRGTRPAPRAASSSPRVSFMRVKPHMSTNAKHRKTRTETVWPMAGVAGVD